VNFVNQTPREKKPVRHSYNCIKAMFGTSKETSYPLL